MRRKHSLKVAYQWPMRKFRSVLADVFKPSGRWAVQFWWHHHLPENAHGRWPLRRSFTERGNAKSNLPTDGVAVHDSRVEHLPQRNGRAVSRRPTASNAICVTKHGRRLTGRAYLSQVGADGLRFSLSRSGPLRSKFQALTPK